MSPAMSYGVDSPERQMAGGLAHGVVLCTAVAQLVAGVRHLETAAAPVSGDELRVSIINR